MRCSRFPAAIGARGCNLRNPTSRHKLANRNVIFRIPTPVFGAGPDGADCRLCDPGEQREQCAGKASIRHTRPGKLRGRRPNGERPDQQQRQRRHHRPVRLEGSEQVAAPVLGRGVQRGNGHHQRPVPDRTGRDAELPVSRAIPTASPTWSRDDHVEAISSIEKFSFFMRFLAPPTPSPDTPGGAASISSG